jgi:hypothetical protein
MPGSDGADDAVVPICAHGSMRPFTGWWRCWTSRVKRRRQRRLCLTHRQLCADCLTTAAWLSTKRPCAICRARGWANAPGNEGLQSGGIALTGKSPINSPGANLNDNLKRDKQLVRDERGLWALSSWQPAPRGTDGRQAAVPDFAATATCQAYRSSPHVSVAPSAEGTFDQRPKVRTLGMVSIGYIRSPLASRRQLAGCGVALSPG